MSEQATSISETPVVGGRSGTEQTTTMTEETPTVPEGRDTLTRDEVNRLIADAIAERDRRHEEELAAVRVLLPTAMVPANGGGPGVDNHQVSWSLAEQEVAARGDTLDHWDV